jgi:hypothetical protein
VPHADWREGGGLAEAQTNAALAIGQGREIVSVGMLIGKSSFGFLARYRPLDLRDILARVERSFHGYIMVSKFTPRQLKFIVAYVAMPNATQAAISAGYSRRSAEVTGCQLIRNAKVKAELDRAFAEDAKQRGVTKDEIVATHRREMYNFVDGTPMSRIRAAEALSRLLGYDRFTVTVQRPELPAHENPEMRAMLRQLPPEKLRAFEEAMDMLVKAQQAKQIDHTPPNPIAT